MKMNTYIVLGGNHTDVDGKVYKRGDKVRAFEPLDELFSNKFHKVDTGTATPEPPTPSKSEAVTATDNEEQDENGAADDRGTNATEKFAKASQLGISVFKKGSQYFLYDDDSDGELLETDGPLTSLPQVRKELDSY